MAPLHRGVKGDRVPPFINHAPVIQGYNAQVVPPCKLEIAKLSQHNNNVDRGPLTTPKSPPAYRVTARLQNSCRLQSSCPLRNSWPLRNNGPALRALGITSLARVTKLDRGPLPPRSRRSLPADRDTVALRNNGPLRNEGASHSKRGALIATSSCRHSPFLPRFYPAFTPFLPRSAPFLPHFYPIFTPLRFVVLPLFYPVFTPFRSIVFTPVLPPFYPTCVG